MQLANTPPLQSTAPGLHPVSIHQTSPLVRGSRHPITAYYSIYRLRKDERLSRPAWLVTYRNNVPPPGVEPVHVTHPSTNRARRRVTSLIRPTPLPLRHAYASIVAAFSFSSLSYGRTYTFSACDDGMLYTFMFGVRCLLCLATRYANVTDGRTDGLTPSHVAMAITALRMPQCVAQ